MNTKYTRFCPECKILITYTMKTSRNRAELKKRLCKSCKSKRSEINKNNFYEKKYTRLCPECKVIIYYTGKAAENNARQAELKKFLCKSCRSKGSKNNFYGKKHSEKTKQKMKNCNKDKSFFNTEEYKEKQRIGSTGSKNPMYGKTVYSTWLKKYGKEKADELLVELKAKQSINSSGSNNPMFGKPSPNGTGNGWKGWYKNIFFRSLRELSYMVYLDQQNIQWKPAEYIVIKYNFLNQEKTYRPDFLIEGKILVEIKPKRLMNTPCITAKKEAAIIYCAENNLEYQLIDPEILNKPEIQPLIDSGLVEFTERYKVIFENY